MFDLSPSMLVVSIIEKKLYVLYKVTIDNDLIIVDFNYHLNMKYSSYVIHR